MSKTKQIQAANAQTGQSSGPIGLTPIQEQAAILLASGKTITDVAATIGVNRSTLYEWQGVVTFQCYFNQQLADYKEQLRNGLFGLTGEALETIKNCLHSDNEPTRLKAATWLLERVAEQTTGMTDLRAALKAKHTKAMEWTDYNHFDNMGFENDCRQYGIKPD